MLLRQQDTPNCSSDSPQSLSKLWLTLFAERDRLFLIFIKKCKCDNRIRLPKDVHVPEPGNILVYMTKET